MLEAKTTTATLPNGVTFLDSHPLGKEFLVQRFQFSNGLQVILMEDPSAPLFTYQTWMRVGSRNERPGISGIAHLFEHLMFKATKDYADGHFNNVIETNGGHLNAGTSKDWTYYYESIPSKNLDVVAQLESQRMQHIVLSDEQINTEKDVVREERRFRIDNNVDAQIDSLVHSTAFKIHPYRLPIIGSKEDFDAISREDCMEFYKMFYAPNNATIVIIGDIDTSETLKIVNKYYGDMPASEIKPQTIPVEPPQTAERRHQFKSPAILDDKVTIAFHVPDTRHEDRIILEVLNSLLIEGKSSRLYRKLVDETKIAANVNGYVDSNIDPGLLRITVALTNGHKAEEAEKVIYTEIERLKQEIVGDKELEKTKNTVEAFLFRLLKTNQYRAFMLGFNHTMYNDYKRMFTEVDHYRAVKAEQIKRAANQYLTTQNRTVIIARPGA